MQPIFLKLKFLRCAIIGNNEIALMKCEEWLERHGKITLFATDPQNSLRELIKHERVSWKCRRPTEADIRFHHIIISTETESINDDLYHWGDRYGKLVNVVDKPDLCNFYAGSSIHKGPISIGVSTSGASPALASQLKREIEALIPPNLDRFANFLASWRNQVKLTLPHFKTRRKFWLKMVSGGAVRELVLEGKESLARRIMRKELFGWKGKKNDRGIGNVYLVGAGPGNAKLLTVRALEILRTADMIVYDSLVSESILACCSKGALRLFVGKSAGFQAFSQNQINKLLVRLAHAGENVVRLKGGDPFIFGRGGEEIESLAKNEVPFEVVPGITAAVGCAAVAKIPLTHRKYSRNLVIATAHLHQGSLDLNWRALVQPRQTNVFYMGVGTVNILVSSLINNGMDPKTPAAIVQQGTLPDQRIKFTDLENLSIVVRRNRFRSPAIIITGDVVSFSHRLGQFLGEGRKIVNCQHIFETE